MPISKARFPKGVMGRERGRSGVPAQPRQAAGNLSAPWKASAVEPPGLPTPTASVNLRRLPGSKATFISPMKALLVEELPRGPQWIYELKFDGVRALAVKNKDGVRLVSRAAKELTQKYPR